MTASKPNEQRTAWLLVTGLIAGAVLLGAGLMAGSVAVIVVGGVVVVAAVVLAMLLPGRHLSAPISFGAEFPADTIGPRATHGGHSEPPIDTEPKLAGLPRPPYPTFAEMAAEDSPATPDRGRVFPQHVTIGPEERLRRIGGRTVIELAEPEPDEDATA